MQHSKNIENKLKEMEAMEQPDLSQMENHWQQMQGILQPGSLPVKKGWPRWMLNTLSVAAVVLLIATAVLYLSSKKDSNNENTVPKSATVAEQNDVTPEGYLNNNNAVAPFITDSTIKEAKAALHIPTINPSLIYQNKYHSNDNAKYWTVDDSLLGTVKLNYTPCENCPGKEAGVLSNAERKLRLTSLFTQLEKPEQHFTIDNSKDTLLQFEEGTVVLVPANSFGGMNGVEFTAKEFYKTSDIVLNQLSTASNKEQLETGGMLKVNAIYRGKELGIDKQNPLRLFMPDTSETMKGMGLFYGKTSNTLNTDEENSGKMQHDKAAPDNSSYVNWLPQNQYFMQLRLVTQLSVLNLVDEPYRMRETKKGDIGYFLYSGDTDIDKEKLKQMLKEKYGYYKVKLRPDFRNFYRSAVFYKDFGEYSRSVGDSVWMDKEIADKYKITGTNSRQIMKGQWIGSFGNVNLLNRQAVQAGGANASSPATANDRTYNIASSDVSEKIFKEIKDKYSVNISQLGWINCDRFYADNRKKINYKVDLGDSANNYYTMIVFDKINSMMTGYVDGDQVAFQNIPIGEPVKVISIGINKKGEIVYSVTHTTTSETGIKRFTIPNNIRT